MIQAHTGMYQESQGRMTLQTRISCQSCFKAKTACDRVHPCGRCRDKNLVCAPRYARRSKANPRVQNTTVNLCQQPGTPTVNNQKPSVAPVIAAQGYLSNLRVGTLPLNNSIPPISPTFDSTYPANCSLIADLFPQVDNEFLAPPWAGSQPLNPQQDSPVSIQLMQVTPPYEQSLDRPYSDGGSLTPRHNPLDSGSPSPRCPESVTLFSIAEAMDMDTTDYDVLMSSVSSAGDCFESLWPLARCNGRARPLSDAEYFKATTKNMQDFQPIDIPSMKYWESFPEPSEPVPNRLGHALVEVVPLRQEARDNLLAAITPLKLEAKKFDGSTGSKAVGVRDCLALPQTRLLDYFIRLSTVRLSGYFSLFPKGLLDPSELALHDCGLKALLTLLMVLCGACTVQDPKVQHFVEILEEACWLQSMRIMGHPVTIARDTAALHACIVSTIHGAWSGRKRLMEAALTTRTSCFESMRINGFFTSAALPAALSGNMENQRHDWTQCELQIRSVMLLRNGRKSRLMSRDARLVYNWLLVDQEISIFYDVEPLVATDGLVWSLPCPDELWNMSDTGQWAERLRAERRRPSRPSLHDVSLAVFNGKDMAFNVCDQTLRLLLYPIQSLITRAHTQAAGMSQAVDIDVSLRSAATQAHIMLRQWQDRVRLLAETRGAEVLSPTSRVLYHLVWVGTAASMGSIEALARADGSVGRLPCLSDTDVAASHSLRALDALRDMAPGDRPAWWPVAVYRCTLALWADAVLDAASPSKKRQPSLFSPPRPGHVGHADTCAYMPSSVVVGMDDDAVESALKTFWVEQEARIYNSTPPVEHQSSHAGVLARGISMLNQQPRSRLADGIIARLQRLKERWQSMDFAGFSL